MKNLKLIIAILTATLFSMAAATSGFGMCADTDTLNILSSGAIQEKTESYDYGTDSRHQRQGKVEGTLIYRKGCIYTSDNQPLSISDSKMYFSPKQVRIYMRNSKVFSTGNSIATIGAGGGLGGALGFMAADASSGREDSFAAVLTASAVVAVAVIVPCTLVGVPMMIKGKARLKKLVRDYNSKYLFAE